MYVAELNLINLDYKVEQHLKKQRQLIT